MFRQRIANNELIKNDLIEQLDKYKRSRTSYLRTEK